MWDRKLACCIFKSLNIDFKRPECIFLIYCNANNKVPAAAHQQQWVFVKGKGEPSSFGYFGKVRHIMRSGDWLLLSLVKTCWAAGGGRGACISLGTLPEAARADIFFTSCSGHCSWPQMISDFCRFCCGVQV